MLVKILYAIFGFLLFFIPGYLLSRILYPKPEDLDFWERIGVSIGLGALIIALIVVILAQPALRALRLAPFLGGVTLFCVFCVGILIFKRKGISGLLKLFKRSKPREPQEPQEPVEEEPPSEEEGSPDVQV